MTAPNTHTPPQAPDPNQLPSWQDLPPMPPDPDVNQQPQQDPEEARQQARTNLNQSTHRASEWIGAEVERDRGRLDTDLQDYKAEKRQQAEEAREAADEDYNAISTNPRASQDDIRSAYDRVVTINQSISSYDNPSDNPEHLKVMLQERVDAARKVYAEKLAARRDTSVAIRSGENGHRKSDLEDARLEHAVAVALLHDTLTARFDAPAGADVQTRERAERDKTLARLTLDLGQPGMDPETNQGEQFKLLRAERDARKVRSGRFELNEDGTLRKDPDTGQAVEKNPGRIAKIRNAFENKWNKWTEQSRSEKRSTRWAGRTKKVVALGAAGAALGAVMGTTAGLAVGAGVALTTARLAKATAGLKLNQSAERSQADADFAKVAAALDRKFDQYADLIRNEYSYSPAGASVLMSEEFADRANASHKRHFISGTVGVAVTLIAGAGGGEFLHHLVYGSDEVSASGMDKDLGQPTGSGGGQDSESWVPETRPPTPEETPGPQIPTPEDTPNSGGTTEPQPQPHPDHEPKVTPDTHEPEAKPGTEQDQGGQSGGHDPDQEKEQKESQATEDKQKEVEDSTKKILEDQKGQQPQGPQAPEADQPAPGEVKQIGPDQMKDKWVVEVYDEQLGEGGFKEMQENATAAMQAGDLEQITQPNGSFYYQLTEQGAAKLPGAGTGSTTTYDVMRILASHSDKIDVA